MTTEEHNRCVEYDLKHEPKWTKKARCRLGKITQMETRMFTLKAEVNKLHFEIRDEAQMLSVELTEMQRANEPDQPWAGWWRRIGCPSYAKGE